MSRRTRTPIRLASLASLALLSACGGDDGADGFTSAPTAGQDDPADDSAGDDASTAARLFLEIVDDAGLPVPHAQITLPQPEVALLRRPPTALRATAETRGGKTVFRADSAGHIRLDDLPTGRFVVRVDAPGYTSATVVRDLPAAVQTGARVTLLRLPAPQKFQAETGASLRSGAAKVDIPAGVVDEDGNPVFGEVAATIVPIDPNKGLQTMPGPLDAITADGAPATLESFAMVEVSLWQGERRLQLAPGTTATLELTLPATYAGRPVEERLTEGLEVPAWWFDLDVGVWREEGVGVVHRDLETGELSWRVEVAHFTNWNMDNPITEHSCFNVTVLDGDGNPVDGAHVRAEGIGYNGVSELVTDASGKGCLAIMIGKQATLYVSDANYQPIGEPQIIQAKDTWGACGNAMGEPCQDVVIDFGGKGQLCNPGDFEACAYTGPIGTKDVGACVAGSNYCAVDGMTWLGCAGETLPVPEVCDPPGVDDNCDGELDNCGGTPCNPGDTKDCYGDADDDPPHGKNIGTCKPGLLHCVGGFMSNECIGDVLPVDEVCDSFDDHDCDGNPGCGNGIGELHDVGKAANSTNAILDIAGAPNGDIYLLGIANGAVEFSVDAYLNIGDGKPHLFLLRTANNFAPLWIKDLGTAFTGEVELEMGQGGEPVIAGIYDAAFALDQVCQFQQAATSGLAWARFENSPNTPAKCIAGAGVAGGFTTLVGVDLDITSGGGMLLTGAYDSFVMWLENNQILQAPNGGVFVAKLSKEGTLANGWIHNIDTRVAASSPLLPAAAYAPDGTVFVQAAYASGAPGMPAVNGSKELFWRRLDSAGAPVWTRQVDLASFDQVVAGSAVAVGPDGMPVFVGGLNGTAKLVGSSHVLGISGKLTSYIAKADGDGNILWTHSLTASLQSNPAPSLRYAANVAVDSANRIAFTGNFSDITIEGMPMATLGGLDMITIKYDPVTGDSYWANRVGGTLNDYAACIAYDNLGQVLVGGSFLSDPLNFANQVIPNGIPGTARAVALRWQP